MSERRTEPEPRRGEHDAGAEGGRGAATRAAAWLVAEMARLGLDAERRTHSDLAAYGARIAAGASRAGLTSVRDPLGIARRHLGESLALLAALRGADLLPAGRPARVVDIGSGAGLPGIPMRVAEPALGLALIESNKRRCAFLRESCDSLGIGDVDVVCTRAEEAGHDPDLRGRFDIAVARAVAPLAVLVEYALPLLAPGGLLAAPKGSRALEEMDAARPAIGTLGGEALDPLPLPLPAGAPPQLVLLVRRVGEPPAALPRRPGIPSRRPLGVVVRSRPDAPAAGPRPVG